METPTNNKEPIVIPAIVTGSRYYIPPPFKWTDEIHRRINYDPHPSSRVDRSFQAYIRTISYAKARLFADIGPTSIPTRHY